MKLFVFYFAVFVVLVNLLISETEGLFCAENNKDHKQRNFLTKSAMNDANKKFAKKSEYLQIADREHLYIFAFTDQFFFLTKSQFNIY